MQVRERQCDVVDLRDDRIQNEEVDGGLTPARSMRAVFLICRSTRWNCSAIKVCNALRGSVE